jgi:hypothetical protein
MDQVQEDRFLELFGGLESLEYLDISLTGYRQFSVKTFPHFRSLRLLIISLNSITFIPDSAFDNNPRLQVLDLAFNNISTVTELTFSKGTRANLEKLYLGGNPFVCNCHLEWFSGWLRSNNTTFEDLTCYRCDNLNTSVTEFITHQQACISYLASALVITFATILIVILIIVMWCYKYYAQIQYRWLLWKFESKRSSNSTGPLRDHSRDDFEYDVFVCYSSEDSMWVLRELMPVLEEQHGMRLCISERDIIVNLGNLDRCVRDSRQCMMVFSKHFARDEFCEFQLENCLIHSQDVGNRLLIVTLPSMMDVSELPSSMAAALAVEGCLPWRESAKQLFWAYLVEAITNNTNSPERFNIPAYLRKRLALPVGNNTLDREVCCRFEG